MSGKTLMWLVSLGIVKPKIVNRVIIHQRDSKEVEKAIANESVSIRANLPAPLNNSKNWSAANLTGACPVKCLPREMPAQ